VTGNKGVQEAMDWLLAHADDMPTDSPAPAATATATAGQEKMETEGN